MVTARRASRAKPAVPAVPAMTPSVDSLGMTVVERDEMATQERITKDWLKAQSKVQVWVPRSVAGGFLRGTYNGIRWEVAADKLVEVPAPIAELIQARVDGEAAHDAVAARQNLRR